MVQTDNGKKEEMQLNLTRERAKAQTVENLIAADNDQQDHADCVIDPLDYQDDPADHTRQDHQPGH